jgi:NADH:ubiquinone oxidoreductase subunit
LPQLTSVEDVPHRGTGEYTYYDTAYFKLSGNEGDTSTPTISSDGLDYPVSLDVLAPNKAWSTDGDVFNRRYEVQTKVYAGITEIGTPPSDWRVWIDKASMVASIRANANKTEWRNLIYNGISEDQQVPPRMRESV